MKTLLTAAAYLMMSAADINDDTLALLGVDNMTVVSDVDGLETHGQGGKNKGGSSTPIIFQKESVKFIDFAYASQKESDSFEARALQFSCGKRECITYIKGDLGGFSL